jgi:hypothetical protein
MRCHCLYATFAVADGARGRREVVLAWLRRAPVDLLAGEQATDGRVSAR